MKKVILGFLLIFIFLFPSYAQETTKIYLPIIWKGDYEMPQIVEKWKVITPIESTNFVLNPSGEISGNFSALGAATVTRSTTYQKYGNYSYWVRTGSNGQGISLTLSSLPNENCFVTFRARGRLPIRLRAIIGTGLSTPLLIEKIDTQWNMYGAMFSAAECSGRTELRIIQQGNGLGDFYVDGIQVENLEYWTSYIDGDQPGCAWNGAEHAATSTRSGLSREGGQVKDLFADYGFFVDKVTGAGATSRSIELDDYALLPGGEINEIKIQSRDWSLIGRFIADSDDEIFQNRKELLTLLKKNAQKQPTKFLFYHPKGVREIKSFYAGGLEGDMSVFYDSWVTEDDDKWAELNKYIEKDAIQLKSPDPYFYSQGNKSVALDCNDSATFRYVAGRLKSTGQWSALGPPNAAGTYTQIYALAEDANYVYIGGNFLNFDNIANADYIVRYRKSTGVYSAMGTGGDAEVFSLVTMPNGDIIAGGAFSLMGGVAGTVAIAKWNVISEVWQPLSTGVSGGGGDVFALAVGLDGTLYLGGSFTVPATRIAAWNGVGYSALGAGTNNTVRALAVSPTSGNLFAGGSFNNPPGERIAEWDIATGAWLTNFAVGADSTVQDLAFLPNGTLLITGSFTSINGVSASGAASWNGSAISALGDGLNATGRSITIGPDGMAYFSGVFSGAGDLDLTDAVAKWNGYSWSHLDLDLPGTVTVYRILASKFVNPASNHKYDFFLGFDTSGTGYFAGKTTVTNEGSVDVFPKFIFERNGGTSIILETIKNETTGKELLFNYTLLDRERLTIDLTPTKKSIVSNYFGSRLDAILANSNFGDFILEIGNSDLTVFTADNFALYPSSLDSFIQWRETYESYD